MASTNMRRSSSASETKEFKGELDQAPVSCGEVLPIIDNKTYTSPEFDSSSGSQTSTEQAEGLDHGPPSLLNMEVKANPFVEIRIEP